MMVLTSDQSSMGQEAGILSRRNLLSKACGLAIWSRKAQWKDSGMEQKEGSHPPAQQPPPLLKTAAACSHMRRFGGWGLSNHAGE